MRTALLPGVALAVLLTAGWNEPASAQPDNHSDAYARAARKASRTETVSKDETISRTKPSAKRSKAPKKR